MKKNGLTSKQINEYNENGYVAPIDILSLEQVNKIREEIEHIEKKWPDEINGLNRNNIHSYSPIFDQVVHNSKILDSVENIIGYNILVAGSVLFVKEPDKRGFGSWPQDWKYQGWEPYNFITAWLAITDVNVENGCMRMWQGSHKEYFKEHKDTFNEDNLLRWKLEFQTDKMAPLLYSYSILHLLKDQGYYVEAVKHYQSSIKLQSNYQKHITT